MLNWSFNPLNSELKSVCHSLALVGAHHILQVGRVRVNVNFTKQVCLHWSEL